MTSTMPSSDRRASDSGSVGVTASADQLCDVMQKARVARCRSRFVVPVILYGHKVNGNRCCGFVSVQLETLKGICS